MNIYKLNKFCNHFTYDEKEDRTSITSEFGKTTVAITYPMYEFTEDLSEVELENLKLDEDEPIAKIENIDVDINNRGLGYGRELLNEAISKAKTMGVRFIYLNACPTGHSHLIGYESLNLEQLVNFYKRHGFFIFKDQINNKLMGMNI